jgi:hypothetical protein
MVLSGLALLVGGTLMKDMCIGQRWKIKIMRSDRTQTSSNTI